MDDLDTTGSIYIELSCKRPTGAFTDRHSTVPW
jgi:hypothetical protein